jgi:hypothetical protein
MRLKAPLFAHGDATAGITKDDSESATGSRRLALDFSFSNKHSSSLPQLPRAANSQLRPVRPYCCEPAVYAAQKTAPKPIHARIVPDPDLSSHLSPDWTSRYDVNSNNSAFVGSPPKPQSSRRPKSPRSPRSYDCASLTFISALPADLRYGCQLHDLRDFHSVASPELRMDAEQRMEASFRTGLLSSFALFAPVCRQFKAPNDVPRILVTVAPGPRVSLSPNI